MTEAAPAGGMAAPPAVRGGYGESSPRGALPPVPSAWTLAVRAFRCHLVAYRRTWRSTVWSSVLGPLFYLGAMGYGLGSLVDRNGTAAVGGVPYVVFVAPAVLAVQAMNTALSGSLYPVYGAVRWNAVYLAARATALRPADINRGHLMFITMRVAMNSACFVVVMAAFGLIKSGWAALLVPAATLTGLAFAAPVAAWTITRRHEAALNYPVRFGAIPLMLFSGTFFPDQPAARLDQAAGLRHAAVARGRAVPGTEHRRARRRLGAGPRGLPGRAFRPRPVGRGPHLPAAPPCLRQRAPRQPAGPPARLPTRLPAPAGGYPDLPAPVRRPLLLSWRCPGCAGCG